MLYLQHTHAGIFKFNPQFPTLTLLRFDRPTPWQWCLCPRAWRTPTAAGTRTTWRRCCASAKRSALDEGSNNCRHCRWQLPLVLPPLLPTAPPDRCFDCCRCRRSRCWSLQVEKDEDYIRTVVRLGAVVEDLVKQNNAIDIYEQYFEGG